MAAPLTALSTPPPGCQVILVSGWWFTASISGNSAGRLSGSPIAAVVRSSVQAISFPEKLRDENTVAAHRKSGLDPRTPPRAPRQ